MEKTVRVLAKPEHFHLDILPFRRLDIDKEVNSGIDIDHRCRLLNESSVRINPLLVFQALFQSRTRGTHVFNQTSGTCTATAKDLRDAARTHPFPGGCDVG